MVVHVRPRLYWPITLAAAALIGLLAYGLASKGTDSSLDQAIANGDPVAAPVSTLPRLGASGSGSLADYKGKPVLINVWASWCDPCQEEMPLLEKANKRMVAAGGTVLGIDVQDDQEKALGFLRSKQITFPSLRDRDRTYAHRFGVTGYPESFLVDRAGRVVALSRGPVDQTWLNEHLPKVDA
jgi:cytochrome c biogenesis protein CcmG/thiol:disulfide interchange protein DsbE